MNRYLITLFLSFAVTSIQPQVNTPKESLTNLLNDLAEKRGCKIAFSPNLTDQIYIEPVEDSQKSLTELFEKMLQGTGLSYKWVNHSYYYIYLKEKPASVKPLIQEPVPEERILPKYEVSLEVDSLESFYSNKEQSVSDEPLPHRAVKAIPQTLMTEPPMPFFALKSNLLYDATLTLNGGVEIGLGQHTSMDISGNYNAWTYGGNRKMKHWMVQPELRIWTCSRFNGSFFGIHGHYAQFNWGGMLPWGFKDGKMLGIENPEISHHRYQGWLAGGGISYGYHWIIGNRWGIEAEMGVGYAYIHYDRFLCEKCGFKLQTGSTHYWGPTKAAVNLVYFLK